MVAFIFKVMVDDRLVTMQIWDTAGQVSTFQNCSIIIIIAFTLILVTPLSEYMALIILIIHFENRSAFNLWVLHFIEEPTAVC